MTQPNMRIVDYVPPGPTIKSFLEANDFVKVIFGPLGSGKTTACIVNILRLAHLQRPGPDGIRRSRVAIIRNSYPELKTTSLASWAQWCPTSYGKFTQDSPIRHFIQSGDLELEVLFLALDKAEDEKKLLSLELSFAFVNEAREIPKAIVDALTGRVGRFPSKKDGGCSWSGILMDSNACDTQNWLYKACEEEKYPGWRFWKQPPGDGALAENLQNLPPNYYERIKAGKDEDWIKVYVRGEWGHVTEGKPVYPMYRDSVHCAKEILKPVPGFPLLLAADWGLTPACVVAQHMPNGSWRLIDEIVTDSCGIQRFAELVRSYIAKNYPDHDVEIAYGDPSGTARSASDEKTCFEIMNAHTKWRWRPAPSNDPTLRREVVVNALNRMVDGQPGILISPKCQRVRKGFTGGYHFRFVKSSNGTQTYETPAKNEYSHPHDALSYLLLGGGEHHVVMGRDRPHGKKPPRFAEGVTESVFGDDLWGSGGKSKLWD